MNDLLQVWLLAASAACVGWIAGAAVGTFIVRFRDPRRLSERRSRRAFRAMRRYGIAVGLLYNGTTWKAWVRPDVAAAFADTPLEAVEKLAEELKGGA